MFSNKIPIMSVKFTNNPILPIVIYRVFVILLPLKFHPKLFLHRKSLYPLDLFFSKLFNKYAAESLSHPSEVKSFSKKITCSSKIDTTSSLYLPSLVLTLFHSFSLPFFFSRKYFVDFSPFSYQFTFDRILEASAFFS